ncbi:MAG: PaaI family thioesterase [Burkholderiaceae bacterium]
MSAIQTLAEWKAQEVAVRKRLEASAPLPREKVVGMSGMQVFEAIFSGDMPSPPIGETMDFIPIQMEHGIAVFQGKPMLRHYNPLGTVHGGWYCTLLDSAMGCAVHTTLPAGRGYTTLEVKVNMLRALTDAVELVRAEGKVIHAGRQVATAEGRIVDSNGKVYGHATTTCMIFDYTSK